MWGFFRGRRWAPFYPAWGPWAAPYGYVDPAQLAEIEKGWLKQYEAYLEAELRLVRERIAQLEGKVPPVPPRETDI